MAVGAVHPVRVLSPFQSAAPSEPQPAAGDAFIPSGEDALMQHKWRKAAGLSLLLLAGYGISTIGGIASPPATASEGVCWANGDLVPGKCTDLFSSMSPEGQAMYRDMGPRLKQWFDQNVNGHAALIIDKRQTFIKGDWHGHDAFNFCDGQIDNKVKDGTMTAADAERAHRIVDVCRHMTPPQRSAFVQMLDVDTGRKK